MPAVTESTMIDSKGEIVTDFFDSVGTSSVSFTYATTQTSIFFRNESDVSITLTVNGSATTVTKYASTTVTAEFTSFSVQSASGVAAFYARTIRGVTANNVSSTTLNVISGSASSPSISPIADSNTGFFFPAAETVAIATNGTEAIRINSSQQLVTTAGTAAAPAIAPTGDTNNGVFFPAADTFAITTNGSERLRVSSAGFVGIANTSPTANLSVKAASDQIAAQFIAYDGSTGSALQFRNNTNASETALIWVHNTDGLILKSTSSAVKLRSGSTDGLIMLSNGYVLVGYSSSNGSYPLQVNGQIFATSATIATSDARYKQNVIPLDGALSIVNALNPVQFDWKQHPVHNFNTEVPTVGFLAQEVEQVLADKPYLNSIVKKSECEYEKDGEVVKEEFLGIAESNLISILTKAVQELSAKVALLESKIG